MFVSRHMFGGWKVTSRANVESSFKTNPVPCTAGNAVPIFNHKHAVSQLGHMGMLQLAHRKATEANTEISNNKSLTHKLT